MEDDITQISSSFRFVSERSFSIAEKQNSVQKLWDRNKKNKTPKKKKDEKERISEKMCDRNKESEETRINI